MPDTGNTDHGHGDHGYGHESRDMSIRVIAAFGAAFTVFLVLTVVLLKSYLGFLWGDGTPGEYAPGGRTASRTEQVSTAPALATTPDMGLGELRAAEDSVLNGYGWVDPDSGIARVPVERAITILAERGFPARTGTGAVEQTGGGDVPPGNDGGAP